MSPIPTESQEWTNNQFIYETLESKEQGTIDLSEQNSPKQLFKVPEKVRSAAAPPRLGSMIPDSLLAWLNP